jgi:hypothetical protein
MKIYGNPIINNLIIQSYIVVICLFIYTERYNVVIIIVYYTSSYENE